MKILLLVVFWGLWYVSFSTRTVISPLLPLIEDELSISHALAGSIFSLVSIGYTVSLLLSGLLSSRIGYKNSIVAGFALLTGAVFSLQYARSFSSFAAVALSLRLGASMYLPCAIPPLTTTFAGENWGKGLCATFRSHLFQSTPYFA